MCPMHGVTQLTFLINKTRQNKQKLFKISKKNQINFSPILIYLLYSDYADYMAIGLWLFMSPRSQQKDSFDFHFSC